MIFPLPKIFNRSMLVFNILALFLLAGCNNQCDSQTMNSLINRADALHASFTELQNLSANHPELKQENIEKAKLLLMEFESSQFPRCAKPLTRQLIKAMQASIEYLDPAGDNFYFPYQLAKFAKDEWDLVDTLIEDYSLNK